MGKLVAFGELLLRLNTPGFQRFSQAGQFEISFAGAEANVAVACAGLGHSASFVTALPANDLAETALRQLAQWNVDTAPAQRIGRRIGVYYLEGGYGGRSAQVIYDREGSAFAATPPEAYDWDQILAGADWLHLTGITPALAPIHRDGLPRLAQLARKRGVRVSFDLNYRSKLSSLAEAREFTRPLLESADLVLASVHQIEPVLGISIGDKSPESSLRAAAEMRKNFQAETVVLTSRQTLPSGRERRWAVGVTATEAVTSREVDYTILDPLGGGDALCGAFLARKMQGDGLGECLDFAVAAAALKYSHHGDYLRVTAAEIQQYLNAKGDNGNLFR